jgi:outer membrane lipoprotein SlyB
MPQHSLFAVRGANDLQGAAFVTVLQRPLMHLNARTALLAAVPVLLLAGCSPEISPDTYNAAAVQQANKVDQGVIIGVRQVAVQVSGNTGAVAGAAAGGVIGGSVPGSSTGQALGTVGGGLLGGLLGSSVEKAAGNTQAWEYIVHKKSGELVSVTQTGDPPLVVGQNVLVIAGSQARIVPDYTVKLPDEQARKPDAPKPEGGKPDADTPPAAPAKADPAAPDTSIPAVAISTSPISGAALPVLLFPPQNAPAAAVAQPPEKTHDASAKPAEIAVP